MSIEKKPGQVEEQLKYQQNGIEELRKAAHLLRDRLSVVLWHDTTPELEDKNKEEELVELAAILRGNTDSLFEITQFIKETTSRIQL